MVVDAVAFQKFQVFEFQSSQDDIDDLQKRKGKIKNKALKKDQKRIERFEKIIIAANSEEDEDDEEKGLEWEVRINDNYVKR